MVNEAKIIGFEQLYKANLNNLYYYAVNIIGDLENAKDIVNDAFMFLWENYDKLTLHESSPIAIVHRRVYTRCLNFLEHQRVIDKYENYLSVSDATFFEDEETYEEYQQRLEQVMKSFDQLPPQTRLVFEECFLRGKKYKEVSEELDISINTVKTHISRALKILRNQNTPFFFILF